VEIVEAVVEAEPVELPEPPPEPAPAKRHAERVPRWVVHPDPERMAARPAAAAPEPDPVPEVEPVVTDERALAVLTSALDTLGAAHHRPFSRG
jgi:hypothetical protein